MFRLALLFVAFIVYGSLFPFTDWRTPDTELFTFLLHWPQSVERADIVQNVLAYAPLGLFIVLWRRQGRSMAPPLLIALACGTLLSLLMEIMQQFEPARTSSLSDLAMNALGTLGGALLGGLLDPRASSTRRLRDARDAWLVAGTLPNIGIVALALWFLSQTSPLVPTFDFGELRKALAPIWYSLQSPATVRVPALLVYACNIFAVGLLLRLLVLKGKKPFILFIAIIGVTFVAKILVQDRQLSLEAIAGGAIAASAVLLWRSKQCEANGIAAIVSLAAGVVISELAPGSGQLQPEFNWMPLIGQMRNLSGLESILEVFWPFFTMAFFARAITAPYRRQFVSVIGGVVVCATVFVLEWMQLDMPGRYADITQVALALIGWVVPWMWGYADYSMARPACRDSPLHFQGGWRR